MPSRAPGHECVGTVSVHVCLARQVVFVVNKADILDGPAEVAAVKEFVADNANRILRLDQPPVIAVRRRPGSSGKALVRLFGPIASARVTAAAVLDRPARARQASIPCLATRLCSS